MLPYQEFMKLNLIEHTYTTDVNLFYEIGLIYTYIYIYNRRIEYNRYMVYTLYMYIIFVGVFLSWNCEYDSTIAVFLSDALKSQV